MPAATTNLLASVETPSTPVGRLDALSRQFSRFPSGLEKRASTSTITSALAFSGSRLSKSPYLRLVPWAFAVDAKLATIRHAAATR